MDWFEAARNGAIEALRAQLEAAQPVDAISDDRQTALRIAAANGHTAVVKLLLEHKADPNADPGGAGRPLKAAVENEHWDAAAALLRGGADPNADGVASIVIAAPPRRQLFALMLSRGLDPNGAHPQWGSYMLFALHDAACCDMLLEAGFDLRRCERETGESMLARALQTDRERFRQLLKLGADVNLPIERSSGQTLLMQLAAEEPSDDVHELIRLLVRRGAAVDQADAAGRTAMEVAADAGHESTRLLLAKLLEGVRKAQARAIEAARLAAEQEAARQKRRDAALKAADTRRRAAAAQARAAKRAAAKRASVKRATKSKKASAKPAAKKKRSSIKKPFGRSKSARQTARGASSRKTRTPSPARPRKASGTRKPARK